MRTVTFKTQSKEIKRLLDLAKKDDVLLQTAGGDEFILSTVGGFDFEIARQRQSKELMAFLEERFRNGRGHKGIPLENVERQLNLPRRKPRKPHRD